MVNIGTPTMMTTQAMATTTTMPIILVMHIAKTVMINSRIGAIDLGERTGKRAEGFPPWTPIYWEQNQVELRNKHPRVYVYT